MLRLIMISLLALTMPFCYASAEDIKKDKPKVDPPSLKFAPPEGKIQTSSLVVVKIQTNGKKVIIKVNSPNVEFKMDSAGAEAVFLFRVAGDYKIWGVTSLNDELVETEILVTVVKRDDNPPTPDPTPVDPLLKQFQDAYNADSSVDKKDKIAGLVRAMRYGADQASVKATNGEVVLAVSQKTKDEIGDNLIGLRKELGKYLNGVLPQENQQLNSDLRNKMSAEYNKVADALEKMSK